MGKSHTVATSDCVRSEHDTLASWRLSPLQLLLPDGVARCSLVVGSNCPATLLPSPLTPVGEHVDLVVLAPSLRECRDQGWLEQAACLIADRLAPEGTAYVLATPRWRFRIARLLDEKGLATDVAIAHVPNWTVILSALCQFSMPFRSCWSCLPGNVYWPEQRSMSRGGRRFLPTCHRLSGWL
jgi:hypothetical protein